METPQERLQYYRETGQAALAKEYEEYLRETGQLAAEAEAAPEYGAGAKALGIAAATGRDIPGAEAAQSTARAITRYGGWKDVLRGGLSPTGISAGIASVVGSPAYREARTDIRGAEDAAPAIARNAARVGGTMLSAAAIPGGMARQGFLYGAADALGSSDADEDLESRIDRAGAQGVVGGAVGGTLRLVRGISRLPSGTLKRVGGKMMPSPVQRGVREWKTVQNEVTKAKALPAEVVPQAEGFVGNTMDNVADVVRAQSAASPAGAVKDAIKHAPTRHRTKAQFEYFADRMAQREQAAANPLDDDLAPLLEQSLKHAIRTGKLPSKNPLIP